jgi:hypothetical protein
LQATVALGRIDHCDADAVLDAAGRVEKFKFEEQVGFYPGRLGHPRHADQRRIADCIGNGIENPAAAATVLRLLRIGSPPLR